MKTMSVNEMRSIDGGGFWIAAAAGWMIGRYVGKGLYRLTHNGYYPGD